MYLRHIYNMTHFTILLIETVTIITDSFREISLICNTILIKS